MATRHLYLVRHGQYSNFPDRGDDLGGGLTETGREQAAALEMAFRDVPLKAIYSSPIRRALETAGFIAQGRDQEISQVDELREVIPCVPPAEVEYFALHFPELTRERVQRDHRQAQAAFERFFQPPANEDIHEALVCHGNLIRYLSCRAMHAPEECWVNLETNHCGITRCTLETHGRMRLVSLNDIGHMPQRLRLFS